MSESDQFRQYAEEALLWAAQSTTKEEKQLLLELVCTWTQAAVASERTVTGPVVNLMEALSSKCRNGTRWRTAQARESRWKPPSTEEGGTV
jgi:hypothetical protein